MSDLGAWEGQLDLWNNLLSETMANLSVSKLGRQAIDYSQKIVGVINAAIDDGHLETMIAVEKFLQILDYRNAQTPLGMKSAKRAYGEYEQLEKLIGIMRDNPKEYVNNKATFQNDGTKMPTDRGIKQIKGNLARLNNRDSFPSLEYKSIWEARIKLAKATQQKLAELHEDTIARYNDILDNEVIDEMAGTISDTPPMAPNPRPAPPTADTGPERGLSR